MNATFEQYLRDETQLDEDAISLIYSLGKERKLKRNEVLLAEGEISRYKVFVLNGLLKTYKLSINGEETIFSFFKEKTWTSLDVESYHMQLPSSFHIAAIEPSKLLIWSKRDFDYLLSELPILKGYADVSGAQKVYLNKQRLITALTSSPEEKYNLFKRDYPELLLRIPLHLVAAYLGISVKTLTRVRHTQILR
jgi:CRP/FNR family transcriptional regulator